MAVNPPPEQERAARLFQEGQSLHQRGRLEEALRRYEQALETAPEFAPARIFRALLLQTNGQPRLALEQADQALRSMQEPDPGVLINYGVIQKNAGRLDAAAQAYEQALEIAPGLLSAQANLGTIYLLQGRFDEAEQRFLELTERMEEPAPWLNLARISLIRQRPADVRRCLERAGDLDPTHPDLSLLQARLARDECDEAAAYSACMQGLRRSPAHPDLWQQLQSLDPVQFELDAVEERLQALAQLEVSSAGVLSIAVDLCRKHWLWQALPTLEQRLSTALLAPLDRTPSSSDVFTLLGADISQRAHLGAASGCWRAITAPAQPLQSAPTPRRRENGEKLRVGILSSDLRSHAIGHLVAGLLEALPHDRIEWWAYHNAFDDASSVRDRLRQPFDRSVNVVRLDSAELAQRIREDGIDVLIDLNQMTAMTRVEVMAWRPAPVQIQWLGMPGSLGGGGDVDYVIVDPWVVDGANADGFSECLLQLPRSYQPNDHLRPDLELCPSRAAAGLPETGVVLGVFNQTYKFSPDTFALWARILQRVPEAWLWLLDPRSDELRERMRHQARCHGIEPERLLFAPHCPQEQHLARLRWMDLVLDTWPYNAHTTCSDALRAGVPVLTLPGRTFAARVASGILATAGLDAWIARDPGDYVERAVAFAALDRAEIDTRKAAVQRTYWDGRMVDNQRFGSELEALLLGVHERAVAGLAPTSLRLTEELKLAPLTFGRQAGEQQPAAPATGPEASLSSRTGEQTTEGEGRLANLRRLAETVVGLEAPPLLLEVGRTLPAGGDPIAALAEASLVNWEHVQAESVGDGNPAVVHRHLAADLDSHLALRHDWLNQFPGYQRWGRSQGSETLATTRLDAIANGRPVRLLRGDLRGCDIAVLNHAEHCLEQLVLLELMAAPTPLHQGGNSLFELGSWLAARGFVLHCFRNPNKRLFLPAGSEANPYAGRNQLLQLEAVFMPDPRGWINLDPGRLAALAFLAHACYRSTDLSQRALQVLDQQDGGSRLMTYRRYLDDTGFSG
jgi:predicted O-linked N-acetylglucosamine transferase (SPINDLY family)